MGFLEAGTPLKWEDALEFLQYVRDHGITQFLEVFSAVKDRENDALLWGDEIEYHLMHFEPATKDVKIALIAHDAIEVLEKQDSDPATRPAILSAWRPEYGSWMVEATPGVPYGDTTKCLMQVELNMAMRRQRIQAVIGENVAPMSVVAFPLMGVGDFTVPSTAPGGSYSESAYVSDSCICPHPRFGTLTANIRTRRGSKVNVNLPLFRDIHTDMTAVDGAGEACSDCTCSGDAASSASHAEACEDSKAPICCTRTCCGVIAPEGAPDVRIHSSADRACSSCGRMPGYVHMDCMAFGMGCCCLQVTFQAKNIAESRHLFDQLSVLSPVMMALTAASPVFRGRLVDTDTRWDVIAGSVDCRTPAERGMAGPEPEWRKLPHAEQSAGSGQKRIYKSRYDSVDCFISSSPLLQDKYNDIPLVIDDGVYARLRDNGVDERLARHIAHLWIRDPLVIFSERVVVDDTRTSEHFENLQSTNWQNVRWKPPPKDAKNMGWRVELRTMEVQLTDFENAAFTLFTVLISRVILFFNLNLYIPLSKVDANMAAARQRDAITSEKFYFRSHVVPMPEKCSPAAGLPGDPDAFELMTCEQILCGTGSHFPGLIPLIYTYLDIIRCDDDTRTAIQQYMHLIVRRVRGELPTCAKWMRNFIRSHPAYKHDSVVSTEIAYDLMQLCRSVSTGAACPELLGSASSVPVVSVSEEGATRLRGSSFADEFTGSECAVLRSLLDKYTIVSSFEDTPAFLTLPAAADSDE